MDDELLRRYEETRTQFVKVELETCFTALELGRFELSRGNIEIAQREVLSIDKGIRTIERFLPGREPDLVALLAELKAKFDSFKAGLA